MRLEEVASAAQDVRPVAAGVRPVSVPLFAMAVFVVVVASSAVAAVVVVALCFKLLDSHSVRHCANTSQTEAKSKPTLARTSAPGAACPPSLHCLPLSPLIQLELLMSHYANWSQVQAINQLRVAN